MTTPALSLLTATSFLLLASLLLLVPKTAVGGNENTTQTNLTLVDCTQYQAKETLHEKLTMEYVVHVPDSVENLLEEDGLEVEKDEHLALSARLVFQGRGWVSLAVEPLGSMLGAEAIIGLPASNPSSSNPGKYKLGSKTDLDGITLLPRQTLLNSKIEQNDTHTVLTFTKLLSEPGEMQIDGNGENTFLFAFGTDNDLGYHDKRDSFKLSFRPCTPTDGGGGTLEALDSPPTYKSHWKAHGIVAVVGWAVAAPIAVACAWLRSLLPEDLWFRFHQFFNVLCFALTVTAFGLALYATRKGTVEGASVKHFQGDHQVVGLVMCIVVTVQVIGGVLRPHVAESKSSTPRADEDLGAASLWKEAETFEEEPRQGPRQSLVRRIWEIGHKFIGVGLLGLSVWQIQEGLKLYATRFDEDDYTTPYWIYLGIFVGLVFALKIFATFFKAKRTEGKYEHYQ